MKRKLENPKIITYENIERVNNILEFYWGEGVSDEIAIEILKALNVPLGTKKEINFFENKLQAYLEKGRKTIIIKQ